MRDSNTAGRQDNTNDSTPHDALHDDEALLFRNIIPFGEITLQRAYNLEKASLRHR
jgi:hypothetical protein